MHDGPWTKCCGVLWKEFLPLGPLPLLVAPRVWPWFECTLEAAGEAALATIEIPTTSALGTTLFPYDGGLELPPLWKVRGAFPINPV